MLFRELGPDADGAQQLHLEFGAERGTPAEPALSRAPAVSRSPQR
jgi:hypothetical protein